MKLPKPTKLELSDIRTLGGRHVLELDDFLTVVVGANNSGKTALLRAFTYIAALAQGHNDTSAIFRSNAPSPVARLVFPVGAANVLQEFPDFQNRLGDFAGLQPPLGALQSYDVSLVEEGHPDGRLRFGDNELVFQTRIMRLERGGVPFEPPAGLQGNEEQLRAARALTSDFIRSVGFWGHAKVSVGELGRGEKRFSGTDEDALAAAITFLRLNHPAEFDLLQHAVVEGLPEVRRISFVERGAANVYVPHLEMNGLRDVPIARNNFGAGAWIFLCVLTAARLAHATRAPMMLLDEPTLFMHPRLERTLLRELTSADRWGGEPMQLVVTTHSPILIDAAFKRGGLRIVEWEDEKAATARVITIPKASDVTAHFASVRVAPGDIFHADTLLFVEGPSDANALSALSEGIDNPCRVLPLLATDWFTSKPKEGRFAVLTRLSEVLTNAQFTRARLLVDADKQTEVERALAKLSSHAHPVVQYAGYGDQDLESMFCEHEFLTHFFEVQYPDHQADASRHVREALATFANGAKGDEVLYGLFENSFQDPERKPEQLGRLARFLVENRERPWATTVWERLESIRKFIDASATVSSG